MFAKKGRAFLQKDKKTRMDPRIPAKGKTCRGENNDSAGEAAESYNEKRKGGIEYERAYG